MLRLSFVAVLLLSLAAAPTKAADVPKQPAKPAALKLAPGETAIYITNMHCPTCAKKIAGKLYRVKGVMKVRTDVKKNLAVVTAQSKKQVDPKAAWTAVRQAGFKPTKLVGPQGTFVADEKLNPVKQTAQHPSAPQAAG
jgi:copper chaperone CopZ